MVTNDGCKVMSYSIAMRADTSIYVVYGEHKPYSMLNSTRFHFSY